MQYDNAGTLKEAQAAEIIGVSPKTLRNWRVSGYGPAWFSAGTRLVRYRRHDVLAWCDARIRRSTSETRDIRLRKTEAHDEEK